MTRPNALFLIYGLLLLLLAGTPASADHLKDYFDGREAFRQKKYRESVVFLDRAIRAEPQAGARVRWTGTHFESYLPHFHLGRALDALGNYDSAAVVWRESIRQGSVLERRNRVERKELERRLKLIEEDLYPRQLDALERQIASFEERRRELVTRGIGGLSETPKEIETAKSVLGQAREGAKVVSLSRASESVDVARRRLLKTLVAVEQGARRRREAEARSERQLAIEKLESAKQIVADGACDAELLAELEIFWENAILETEELRLTNLSLLARGSRQCGNEMQAQQYETLALLERGKLTTDSADTLQAYLVARATVQQYGCNPEAIARMQELGPELSVDLMLDLAEAYRRCGDAESVTRQLDAWKARKRSESEKVKELTRWLDRSQLVERYVESHALLVGLSEYEDGRWEALPEVEQDLDAMSEQLEGHRFKVQRLLNPTRDQLVEALQKFFSRKREPNSRLVFYYAGHGHTEINDYLRLGYIVPADTPFPSDDVEGDYLRKLVSMDGFEQFASTTPARHALLLFDSCFAGTIFDSGKDRFQMTADKEGAVAAPARLFITAGDETQMVPADSQFRKAVVRAFDGEADDDVDGFIMGREIGRFVTEFGATTRNDPQWGLLRTATQQPGDIAFDPPTESRSRTAHNSIVAELALWIAARRQNDSSWAQQFAERYPQSLLPAPLDR